MFLQKQDTKSPSLSRHSFAYTSNSTYHRNTKGRHIAESMVQQDSFYRSRYQCKNNTEGRSTQISNRQQSEPCLRQNREQKHRNDASERPMIIPVPPESRLTLDKDKHLNQENSKPYKDQLLQNQDFSVLDPKLLLDSRFGAL